MLPQARLRGVSLWDCYLAGVQIRRINTTYKSQIIMPNLLCTYQSSVMFIFFLDKRSKEVMPSQGFFYLEVGEKGRMLIILFLRAILKDKLFPFLACIPKLNLLHPGVSSLIDFLYMHLF